MNDKNKTGWMTRFVIISLSFTAIMIIACYVGRWFGVDTSHELTITSVVFGGELVLLMGKKLTEDKRKKEKQEDHTND